MEATRPRDLEPRGLFAGVSNDQRRREGHSMKLSPTLKEAVADAQLEISQEETAEAGSGDLEHAKTAVLNSLTSASGQTNLRARDPRVRHLVLL